MMPSARPDTNPLIGVCSWSLQPKGPQELLTELSELDVDGVQLALSPLIREPDRWGRWGDTFTMLDDRGISVLSGMMETIGEDYSTPGTIRRTGGLVPDHHWQANLDHARAVADLAAGQDISLVTFHAGFLPEDEDDPQRPVMIQRIRAVADVFADRGVSIGLETGQESASGLLALLDALEHRAIGVNFDPANMLLYGTGDPIAAFRALADRVVQVHIKDANPPAVAGQWGTEVPAGTGSVQWDAFFDVLLGLPRPVAAIVEREAGTERLSDIQQAVRLARVHLQQLGPGG